MNILKIFHDMTQNIFEDVLFCSLEAKLAHACLHTHLFPNVVAHSSYHYCFANLDDHVVLIHCHGFWVVIFSSCHHDISNFDDIVFGGL
jgi:hypothetical protein